MLFGLFNKNKDNNKTNKKRKEQIGDKIIIKSAYDAMSEEQKKKQDATCPECGRYHSLNSICRSSDTYNFYKCRHCKCEWKVRKNNWR